MSFTDNYDTFLWAKSDPFVSLYTHMLCVGICAQELILAPSSECYLSFLKDSFGYDSGQVKNIIGYVCSLHDIGKAHPLFQRKAEKQYEQWKKGGFGSLFQNEIEIEPFRHEYYSGKILKRIWAESDIDPDASELFASIIELHHQKRKPRRIKEPKATEWSFIQRQLECRMSDFFLNNTDLIFPHNTDATGMLITGILIIADWIASSSFFDLVEGKTNDEIRKHSRTVIERLGLISDGTKLKCGSFQETWPDIDEPRPIQQVCEDLDPSAILTIIEAPMGEGKTEAALFFAARVSQYYRKRGFYMALPTQATSDQMHQRINGLLNAHGIREARLLHGNAKLFEEVDHFQTEDDTEAMKWMRPLRMGLLEENGVGTVDQVMAAVLLSRFSMIRFVGLENKVLIIDEIHAYDMYMSEIIGKLLEWCRALQIPVILLSATLQDSQKQRYLKCFAAKSVDTSKGYPLLTQVLPEGDLIEKEARASSIKEIVFISERIGYDPETIADRAMEKVAYGGCIALIMNTVKHAQEVFLACKLIKPEDVELILFHGRFPVGRRKEIESICVRKFGKKRDERPLKGILIATQVVEQSIDLDFDCMFSEIAPIDLLLQRAGRVHRHTCNARPEKMVRPEIVVLLPNELDTNDIKKRFGSSGVIYEPFVLSNTESIIGNGLKIELPNDVRDIIEKAYNSVTAENIKAHFSMMLEQGSMKNKADACIYTDPKEDTFFPIERPFPFILAATDDGYDGNAETATRLGNDQIRIAFCSEDQFKAVKNETDTLEMDRSIYLNSVSVRIYPGDIDEAKAIKAQKGMLRGIYLVNGERYSELGNYRLYNDIDLGVRWEVME